MDSNYASVKADFVVHKQSERCEAVDLFCCLRRTLTHRVGVREALAPTIRSNLGFSASPNDTPTRGQEEPLVDDLIHLPSLGPCRLKMGGARQVTQKQGSRVRKQQMAGI